MRKCARIRTAAVRVYRGYTLLVQEQGLPCGGSEQEQGLPCGGSAHTLLVEVCNVLRHRRAFHNVLVTHVIALCRGGVQPFLAAEPLLALQPPNSTLCGL